MRAAKIAAAAAVLLTFAGLTELSNGLTIVKKEDEDGDLEIGQAKGDLGEAASKAEESSFDDMTASASK